MLSIPTMISTPDRGLRGEAGLAAWEAAICAAYGPTVFNMERPDLFSGHFWRSAGALVSAISGNVSRVQTDGVAGQGSDDASVFLVIAKKGEAMMRQGRASLLLQPGDITIADPDRCWDYSFSRDFAHLSVLVPRSLLSLHPDGPDAMVLWHCHARSRLAKAVSALAGVMAEDETDPLELPGNELDVHASLIDFLAGAVAAGEYASLGRNSVQGGGPALRRVLRIVDEHLTDPEMSPIRIAGLAGVSLRTLYRVFQQGGLTFTSYVLGRRLDECHRKLLSPRYREQAISDIAFSHGFNDLSYFSRSFRRRFGMTPTAVRGGSDVSAPKLN